MNYLRLLTYMLLFCLRTHAQDIILKTDRTEVSAKVTELTTSEVKFKYFNRQDGPTYALKKSEVFAIVYQDGTRETFTNSAAPPVDTPQDSKRMADLPTSANIPSTVRTEKRIGFTGGLFYTTPSMAFGQSHGFGVTAGFYFLGRSRKGAGLIEFDQLFFFNDVTTRFGLISFNGVVRTSENGRFYLGGGGGLGTISTEITTYDYALKRNTTKRVGELGFGGKAFIGYGAFRVSLLMPFLENSDGGLVTVGFVKSIF